MIANSPYSTIFGIQQKVKSFVQLMKLRLSLLVVFSAGMAYILGAPVVNWGHFIIFCIGGLFVTGAANTINQMLEVDYDKLMKRTMNRPLPTKRLTMTEAGIFSLLMGGVGIFLHFMYINPFTGILSFLSLMLYAFAYTPLKRVGPIAVFVGALPGALPPLIGWVAATSVISYEALILFGIQFIWQFPHFWAIAWVGYDDYKKAGYELLPSKGGRDLNTAFNIMIYTLFLIPISLLPALAGVTGKTSAVIVTIAGVLFLIQTFLLMKRCDQKAALWMMFGSFLYLPIVQIAFVADKL